MFAVRTAVRCFRIRFTRLYAMIKAGTAISRINVVCPEDDAALVVVELEADCVAAAEAAVPEDASLEAEVLVMRVLLEAVLTGLELILVELESLLSWALTRNKRAETCQIRLLPRIGDVPLNLRR